MDGIFIEKHNSNDITTISNNLRSVLNPIRADDEQNDDDRPEHGLNGIYLKALQQFIRLKDF